MTITTKDTHIRILVKISSLLESTRIVSSIVHVIRISHSIRAIDRKKTMFLVIIELKYSDSTVLLSKNNHFELIL